MPLVYLYASRAARNLAVSSRDVQDRMSDLGAVVQENLSGIRTIHPVVDITNYVMIELGQPMHGFDAEQLKGSIRVRRAKAGEQLKLLNEHTGADGGPITLAAVNLKNMSDAELAQMQQLMAKATADGRRR